MLFPGKSGKMIEFTNNRPPLEGGFVPDVKLAFFDGLSKIFRCQMSAEGV